MRRSVPLSCCLAVLLRPAAALAAPAAGNAAALIDAFLADAAVQTSAYRTDLQPAAGPTDAGPGRRFAVGPLAGPFTYRAKTYRELSPQERAEVWRDSAFAAFLRRSRTDFVRAGSGGGRDRPIRIELTAAEMLLARPGSIALPNP
jgi:hypothetical protein